MNRKVIVNTATAYDCSLILDMQIENHKMYLDEEEQKKGYVTLLTPLHYLQQINYNKQLLVARYAEGDFAGMPAGYLITVDGKSVSGNPFLEQFANELSNKYGFEDFVIIAQIGVRREEVGKRSGIGTQIYKYFFNEVVPYLPGHKIIVTEVSVANQTSHGFHLKVGFKTFDIFKDKFGNEMVIVTKTK